MKSKQQMFLSKTYSDYIGGVIAEFHFPPGIEDQDILAEVQRLKRDYYSAANVSPIMGSSAIVSFLALASDKANYIRIVPPVGHGAVAYIVDK